MKLKAYKLESLPLNIREWVCPSCNVLHDRDLNASINIKNFGQLDCYDQLLPSAETVEMGLKIPTSLQKFTSKIERSPVMELVMGAGKLSGL